MQTERGGTLVSSTVSVFNDSSLAFFRGCHVPLWLFVFKLNFGGIDPTKEV